MQLDRTDAQARERILRVIHMIPPGRVCTYGRVATLAALRKSWARVVGNIVGSLPADTRLPWHRIINSQGRLSMRPGPGYAEQIGRLEAEAVVVTAGGRVDLQKYGWPQPWNG